MASINRTSLQPVNYTHEGGVAKTISPLLQLRRSVMSCLLWEKEAYEDGKSIAERIKELVAVLPAQQVADIAIEAKEKMKLRHTPLYLLRLLCTVPGGNALVGKLLPRLITRPDDMTEFLSLYWQEKKQPLAKQVKKGLAEALKKFDAYQLGKYNGGSKSIKLRDVILMVHPKPKDAEQSALWKRLLDGTLESPDTWEVALSTGKDKTETWRRLIAENKLGGLATLRNLRNMSIAGLSKEERRDAILSIKAQNLLPINFIAAAAHDVQNEEVLEQKFLELFKTEGKVLGKTILLVDTSGSMNEKLSARSEMTRFDVAASLAMIAREKFENGAIFSFNDNVHEIPPRHGFALRDSLKVNSGGGTYLGATLSYIKDNFTYERIIVITDEQTSDNVGSPRGKGYIINVASAQHGVGYREWVHIDGWSDKVLDYITEYEALKCRETA